MVDRTNDERSVYEYLQEVFGNDISHIILGYHDDPFDELHRAVRTQSLTSVSELWESFYRRYLTGRRSWDAGEIERMATTMLKSPNPFHNFVWNAGSMVIMPHHDVSELIVSIYIREWLEAGLHSRIRGHDSRFVWLLKTFQNPVAWAQLLPTRILVHIMGHVPVLKQMMTHADYAPCILIRIQRENYSETPPFSPVKTLRVLRTALFQADPPVGQKMVQALFAIRRGQLPPRGLTYLRAILRQLIQQATHGTPQALRFRWDTFAHVVRHLGLDPSVPLHSLVWSVRQRRCRAVQAQIWENFMGEHV